MKNYRYQNCHCHTNSLEVCAKFVNPTSNCSGAKYIEPCKLGSITFLCIPNVVNRPFCEEKPKHPSYIPTTHRMPCLFPRLPASIIPCTKFTSDLIQTFATSQLLQSLKSVCQWSFYCQWVPFMNPAWYIGPVGAIISIISLHMHQLAEFPTTGSGIIAAISPLLVSKRFSTAEMSLKVAVKSFISGSFRDTRGVSSPTLYFPPRKRAVCGQNYFNKGIASSQ